MTQIKDASGACYGAKVDNSNRLHTQAITIDYKDYAVIQGESFALNSSIITLTSDQKRDLIYFKNTDLTDSLMVAINFQFGTPTANSGSDWIGNLVINPTGGTLLSATDGVPINNNLGSANTLTGVFKIGDSTTTATGGFPAEQLFPGEFGIFEFQQIVVIPQGFSIAVGITPPSGTTSVDVSIGTTIIKQTIDLD